MEVTGARPGRPWPVAQIRGTELMRHYTLEQWIDFARNMTESSIKERMQSHLDAGCARCSKELAMWQHLHQVAQRTSNDQPSEGALRSCKNAFESQRAAAAGLARRKHRSSSSFLIACAPRCWPECVPPQSHSRQLLYGSATYRIDVRIEPQIDSEKVILIGQILNSCRPARTAGRGAGDAVERPEDSGGERDEPSRRIPDRVRDGLELSSDDHAAGSAGSVAAVDRASCHRWIRRVPQPLDISMVKDRRGRRKKVLGRKSDARSTESSRLYHCSKFEALNETGTVPHSKQSRLTDRYSQKEQLQP